ncbi:MAG: TonB-dependent receptor [Saprospirales bacterium]|nr:MAG: TonB-dependent receptor [Saprospirales bacterium]
MRRIVSTCFLLGFLLGTCGLKGQEIAVVDAKTGESLPHVYAEWTAGSDRHFAVACERGRIPAGEMNLPVVLTLTYVGYQTLVDTLESVVSQIKMTPSEYQFQEVVVTGQFTPQSATRSVYQVRTLDSEEMDSYGARDMSDIMVHQLNFRPRQDVRMGTTSFSLQGISGNNLLILLDGVPINGRTSDDFDFGQISPQQIDRVEIVEGPMAVLYGSNAMAGVVNLITRRNYEPGWSISAQIHEESAGSEYGWDQGTHNQSLLIGRNFESLPLTVSGGVTRNLFHGYQGDFKRAMLWKPKEQWIGNLHFQYRPQFWDISLRMDHLYEEIFAPGEPVGTVRPIALDDTFETRRTFYQLQAGRSLPEFGRIETMFAVTDYEREKIQKAVNLNTGSTQMSTAEGAQDHTSLFGFQNRTVVNYLMGEKLSAQMGYDFEYEKISGGRLIDGHSRSLYELGVFLSFEKRFSELLSLRPGLRYSFNNRHSSPFIPSLNLKYDFHPDWQFRAAYSHSYRAPSLREMYFEFFDSNHRIIGNENLIPESGRHYNVHLSNRSLNIAGNPLHLTAEVFYNRIKDQITYGRSTQNIQNTTLINQSMFKSQGFRFRADYSWNNFSFSPSFALTGRNNIYSQDSEDMGFLYSPEVGLSVRYRTDDRLWNFALNYQFYGEQPVYGIDVEDITQEVQLASVDPFHLLDLNLSRRLWTDLRMTLGVRNLLNVTDINSTPAVGTIHPFGDVEYISYGRSVFLTINYSFNK